MRKAPNPKIYIALAVLTILLGGSAVYFQWGAMSSLSSEVETLERETTDTDARVKELEQSRLKLTETSTKLQNLELSVSEKAYVPTMLAELERVGRQNGITVLGVRPMPAPPQPRQTGSGSANEQARRKAYEELVIEIKGQGQYRDLLNFTGALNTFPKIVAVRTVSVSPRPTATPGVRPGDLEATIEIRAYVFPAATRVNEAPMAEGTAAPDGSGFPSAPASGTDAGPTPGMAAPAPNGDGASVATAGSVPRPGGTAPSEGSVPPRPTPGGGTRP